MALTLAELETRFPGGPSVAYRTAAERALVVLPGELGGVVAAVLQSHAAMRDVECSGRRLNPTSWLISASAPNALAAVLLQPQEENMSDQEERATQRTPAPGRIVLYTLSEADARAIYERLPSDGSLRNAVHPGDVYPAIVVREWDTSVNLQVFLDGACSYWATSRVEGDEPGHWHWPDLV